MYLLYHVRQRCILWPQKNCSLHLPTFSWTYSAGYKECKIRYYYYVVYPVVVVCSTTAAIKSGEESSPLPRSRKFSSSTESCAWHHLRLPEAWAQFKYLTKKSRPLTMRSGKKATFFHLTSRQRRNPNRKSILRHVKDFHITRFALFVSWCKRISPYIFRFWESLTFVY